MEAASPLDRAPSPDLGAPAAQAGPGAGPSDPCAGGRVGATRPLPSLTGVRAAVLRRPDLAGIALCTALSDAYDGWLAEALGDCGPGVALVAVGGLGRAEPAPYADLDLVLLHGGGRGGVHDVRDIADRVWYPIWDAKVALDHSVRTVDEAVDVAEGDLKAMLGMLDLRHVAGDRTMSDQLRERIRQRWRATAPTRGLELLEAARSRWASAGDAAFLLEPNLKDSRGALRDWQALRALAVGQLIDIPPAVLSARAALLALRGELHRHVGRATDVLRQQEQAAVAALLGMPDADAALRTVNDAARTIAYAADHAWRRVQAGRPAPAPRRGAGTLLRRRAASGDQAARIPLAEGVVEQGGEVVLAREADPAADAGLLLRAARAAASRGLPLAPFALERLAAESSPLPEPWPAKALEDLVGVLDAGEHGIVVMEELDQAGLMIRLIPEWASVRIKAQHNAVHRFTVDRHLMETASQASRLTRDVARPDLLLIGSLLHDIGKGYPGDHSIVGAEVARVIAPRMGLPTEDVETVAALVRHHLLLPDTATRRDLDDPATIRIVTDAVAGSSELLELLHALTIADAAATGPAAWSEWKAGLVASLVRRTHAAMNGQTIAPQQPLDTGRLALAQAGELAVHVDGGEVVVAAPDAPGLLSRASGVLALHGLDVRSAAIATYAGTAVNRFVVQPRFGSLPESSVLQGDLRLAVADALPLGQRLAAKEQSYGRDSPANPWAPPPRVLWFDDEATDATVLELRAADSIGLLHRVTAVLERRGLDIRSALVSTLGASVVDAFYVTSADGSALVPAQEREAIAAEVLQAAGG
jgi:[protein-PII] uridylyltransferase